MIRFFLSFTRGYGYYKDALGILEVPLLDGLIARGAGNYHI